ncbi:AfsR/SARP family transcriptional regulator [Mycolicibacterium pulveris]|uniref:SARP family transcriptional regulator n=1 Tax=Mycolicibacterium pulveris TaxID=36813 RepID=A0A7I7UCB8_MYCPV|nr:BTAD domain-containing putative transcriptional regulator [Mycolicibacterium pulveris]MCV6981902.1 AfsR/SARP family transcriptional regulator [Mycolicibacterium pulveris]BBY79098.1 SARP family transcriptional regulator [Mycolicibacterium pulveris]
MTVEFRILGEIEAYVDGRRLDIGHARQRCVLVSLLVDVNRPVSTHQLIDRVWADEPPHRARNTLAAYISRVRQLLGVTDDVQVVRGPSGYTLSAEPLAIDLHRFRHLVSAARSATDVEDTARMLERALALWRGEPFAVIETPWANGLRNVLERERFSALLDRNDAALAAGRHADVLASASEALDENPLDERLAGQLMLAQYRGGRQADALDTYRTMRQRLVDELGVDPGPALRAVHQQILDGDPHVPAAVPKPQLSSVQNRPGLPRRASTFIGRQPDVTRISVAVNDCPLVTLTGAGGVGKTRLAVETADRIREHFADGVWICELAPLDAGGSVSQAVAAALRLQPREGLDFVETVIDHLRTRELLLVVDNCEHVLDDAAALIDRITRRCPRVSVLTTSRAALGVEGERVLPVEPLPEEDATALFADRAKASRGDFALDHEPVGAVAEICRRLDGLPLAIELAAARMRAMSSLDIARRLDRLRLLSGGARGTHPRHQSVTATIDWSYRLLSVAEQSLFERLSVFAGGFDLAAAHGVCADDGNEDDTLDLLAGLVDKSMVVVRGGTATTRYDLLETLRAYGRERLQDKGVREDCAVRHATYFTELLERGAAGVHTAEERCWVERFTPNARNTFTAPDYDNLRAAFERSIAVGDVDLALRLVTAMPELLHLRIGYHSIGWAERAVEVADPEHPLYVTAVGVAARGRWVLGEFARARSLAEPARGRAPNPGASYLGYPEDTLADVALYEGDAEGALRHYVAEAEHARRDANPFRLLWILYNITICHDAQHTPGTGISAAQEAMTLADTTDNPTARAMARCALGRVLKCSEPERALDLFDEAVELAGTVQNNWLIGIASTEGAAVRATHGDPATAAQLFIEVLEHWGHGGPGTGALHWLTLRYIARFFAAHGADADAIALHRTIVEAGQQPPLEPAVLARIGAPADGTGMTGAEAVDFARSRLQRYL